jgi:hypothetical protein
LHVLTLTVIPEGVRPPPCPNRTKLSPSLSSRCSPAFITLGLDRTSSDRVAAHTASSGCTLGGCVISYISLFWCPIIYFRLFLVHKISAYKYIYENGEKKWEKKKKKGFPASWAGGGGFRPTRRERARGRACGLVGPAARERQRGTAPWRGAHTPERGGWLTALMAMEGGGVRPKPDRRRNPTAVLRRWSGSTVGRWWRGTGGCRGSREWG